MTLGVLGGTFDPIHNGHLEVIEVASRLFDDVVVAAIGDLLARDPLATPADEGDATHLDVPEGDVGEAPVAVVAGDLQVGPFGTVPAGDEVELAVVEAVVDVQAPLQAFLGGDDVLVPGGEGVAVAVFGMNPEQRPGGGYEPTGGPRWRLPAGVRHVRRLERDGRLGERSEPLPDEREKVARRAHELDALDPPRRLEVAAVREEDGASRADEERRVRAREPGEPADARRARDEERRRPEPPELEASHEADPARAVGGLVAVLDGVDVGELRQREIPPEPDIDEVRVGDVRPAHKPAELADRAVGDDPHVLDAREALHRRDADEYLRSRMREQMRDFGAAIRHVHRLQRRAAEISKDLRFLLRASDADFVYYVETRGRGIFLRASPIDVSRIVREALFDRMRAVVLTSATLAVDGSFTYVKGRLGIREADEVRVASEFDYGRQALLYLPRRIPSPKMPSFAEAAAKQIIEILRRSRGRAFVLFTSYSVLRTVQPFVEMALPYPILVQGSAPRTELIDRFRATPNAVLLATSSFWQGVDVMGDALSCVIIDRLPFASPGDPITAARIEAIADRGGQPFGEYQVPLAILTLLQGLGRLIRHRDDRGVLAVLDPRLQTMGYGRRFLASLPPAAVTRDIADVERFFAPK